MEYILNIFRYISITADSWNNKNAFTTNVDTIFDDCFINGLVGIIKEEIANFDTPIFTNGLLWS